MSPETRIVEQNAVSVVVVPGDSHAVLLDPGATVADACEAAGVPTAGMQIRRSGSEVSLDTEVVNGDRLILARQIKGN